MGNVTTTNHSEALSLSRNQRIFRDWQDVYVGRNASQLRVSVSLRCCEMDENECQYRRQSLPRCWRKNQPVADDMTGAPIGALVIFGLDPGLSFSLRAALREAVGFTVHFQDVDVVGQAVEERAGL